MCYCIDDFNERLRADTGDPNATLDLAHWGGVEGVFRCVKMRYFFRPKHRNGALAMKVQNKLIKAKYCPFCGEKQIKEPELKPQDNVPSNNQNQGYESE